MSVGYSKPSRGEKIRILTSKTSTNKLLPRVTEHQKQEVWNEGIYKKRSGMYILPKVYIRILTYPI